MGVALNHFNGIFLYKPSILGYPHLWKAPDLNNSQHIGLEDEFHPAHWPFHKDWLYFSCRVIAGSPSTRWRTPRRTILLAQRSNVNSDFNQCLHDGFSTSVRSSMLVYWRVIGVTTWMNFNEWPHGDVNGMILTEGGTTMNPPQMAVFRLCWGWWILIIRGEFGTAVPMYT